MTQYTNQGWMPIKHSQRHHYMETIYMEIDIAENTERCHLFTILTTCWRATARLANSSVSECFMNHCASACSFVSPPFLSTEVSAAVAARNHCLSYLCSSSMFLTNISSMASTQTPTNIQTCQAILTKWSIQVDCPTSTPDLPAMIRAKTLLLHSYILLKIITERSLIECIEQHHR